MSLRFGKIPHPMLYDCSQGFPKTIYNIGRGMGAWERAGGGGGGEGGVKLDHIAIK